MPKLDKKTGRLARMSKVELLAKLAKETRARQEAREDLGMPVPLEPWEIPVPLIDYDPDLDKNSATSADALVRLGAQEVARLITVVTINGKEMELLVQPGEIVRALAKRLALIKGVGRVRLLVDHAPLLEDMPVLNCVPHACVVTAVFQFGFDLPNRLGPIVQQQIRISCELHGLGPWKKRRNMQRIDPEPFWNAAFEKPNWQEFAEHIRTQDFQIRVFSYGLNPLNQTRFIYYNFGLCDHGYGSVHAENESRATASYDDGDFELLVDAPHGFLSGLEEAACAEHGVEQYGI